MMSVLIVDKGLVISTFIVAWVLSHKIRSMREQKTVEVHFCMRLRINKPLFIGLHLLFAGLHHQGLEIG